MIFFFIISAISSFLAGWNFSDGDILHGCIDTLFAILWLIVGYLKTYKND